MRNREFGSRGNFSSRNGQTRFGRTDVRKYRIHFEETPGQHSVQVSRFPPVGPAGQIDTLPPKTYEYYTNLMHSVNTLEAVAQPVAVALLDPFDQRHEPHKILHGVKVTKSGKIETISEIAEAAVNFREHISRMPQTQQDKQQRTSRDIGYKPLDQRHAVSIIGETLRERLALIQQPDHEQEYHAAIEEQSQRGYTLLKSLLPQAANYGYGLYLHAQYLTFAYETAEDFPEQVRVSDRNIHAYESALRVIATAIDSANPTYIRYPLPHVTQEEYIPVITAAVALASAVYSELSEKDSSPSLSAHTRITDSLLEDTINMVSLKHSNQRSRRNAVETVAQGNDRAQSTQQAFVTEDQTTASQHYAEQVMNDYTIARVTGYYATRHAMTEHFIEYLYHSSQRPHATSSQGSEVSISGRRQ